MICAGTLLALAILSPRSGETVATHKELQRDYLAGCHAERCLKMDSRVDRERFLSVGNCQRPLRVAWTNASPAVRVSVSGPGAEPATISVTNRSELWLTNLELGRDYCVRVEDEAGGKDEVGFRTEATPPRLLKADGVSNFRDLGGWRTVDGGKVRQGLVFRCAGLRSSSKTEGSFLNSRVRLGAQRVTPAGIATLKGEFGIKTDLELRTPQETAGMATTLLDPARWVNVSFAAYGFIDNPARGREPFARVFKVFTARENYPVLMHCSGGRDRTGTLAFLLNGLLGVSEEDLLRDWEMSIFSDDGATFSSARIEPLVSYLNGLPGETLKDRIETYVRSCGVGADEIAAFREIMLEDSPQ